MVLALTAAFWHDCSHEEEVHLDLSHDADTELSQEHHCVLCDYVSPELTIDSFSFALLGNAPFWHAPTYNQDSAALASLELPSLRGPPLGLDFC